MSPSQSSEDIPPQDLRHAFFVYVIESPSAPDLYAGIGEGHRMAQALELESIPCVVRTAINAEAFFAAFKFGLPQAIEATGRYPVIHLSAHGNEQGIQLSSGESIGWDVLRGLLLPVNESLNGVLLLAMSACQGFSACKMAMSADSETHPYIAMVGDFREPTWADTVVGFLTFYHLVAKGRGLQEAVDAMNIATGEIGWSLLWAEEIRQGFIEFASQKVDVSSAQAELESAAQGIDSPEAKVFRVGHG